MHADERTRRLEADLECLQQLQRNSSIFEFEHHGQPPDRYTLVFKGRGITRDTSPHADIKTIDLHRCDLRLPYSYPARPPDLRWLTPIFHPNVSFSGFIQIRDLGLPWEARLTLDVLCERLWDVARLAYLDLEHASNYGAKSWFRDHSDEIELPQDPRPLRDRAEPRSQNVVRYERRGHARRAVMRGSGDVLYIGEDTPTPEIPSRGVTSRRSSDSDDDNILYIGDDS